MNSKDYSYEKLFETVFRSEIVVDHKGNVAKYKYLLYSEPGIYKKYIPNFRPDLQDKLRTFFDQLAKNQKRFNYQYYFNKNCPNPPNWGKDYRKDLIEKFHKGGKYNIYIYIYICLCKETI